MRFAAAIAVAASISAVPAKAIEVHDLAGWWIAIDDVLPSLWRRGIVVAMEELLLVDTDGRVEDRVMRFFDADPETCRDSGSCSDAPLIARARLTLEDDRLAIHDRVEATGRLDHPDVDAYVRRSSVTSAPWWTVRLEAGGRRLELSSSASLQPKRTLVRIEPDQLRRLRAGFLFSGLSAMEHWRCYLANATAGDPAFAPLHTGGRAPTSFLEEFLRAASYAASLQAMAMRPTADDPDPERGKLTDVVVEALMAERFDDVRAPVTFTERRRLAARHAVLRLRASGESTSAAVAAVAPIMKGEAVNLAVTEREIGALGRVLREDPEAKRLFCRR